MKTDKDKATLIEEEDDDFVFGDPTKTDDGKKGEDGSGDPGDTEGAGDPGGDPEPDPDDDDGEEGKEKKEEDKKGEEGKEEGEKDEEGEKGEEGKADDKKDLNLEDLFGDDADDDKGEGEKPTSVNLIDLAKELEVDAKDLTELKQKVSERIEKSKKEFKLDGLTPDAQAVVKHLNEHDGKLDDFFVNPEIAQLQSVIAMDAESKLKYVTSLTYQTGDQKLSAADANKKAEEDVQKLSTREIKDASDQIDSNAREMIGQHIQTIVGDRKKIAEEKADKERQRVASEIKNIENYITDQKEFIGLNLSKKAKENIVRDIRSGKFDEIANADPVKSKYAAYMFAKFSGKLNEAIKTKLSEANRKGYNSALDKSLGALHKTKEGAQGKTTGRQDHSGGQKKNFEDWSDHFDD